MPTVYNPLDKANLGKSVADALLEQEPTGLDDIERFEGAGIYAIYYRGDFPAYKSLAEANQAEARWPIYVGKAIPSGARKGASLTASARGISLFSRLSEHRESVRTVEGAGSGLRVQDFAVRYLVVDDIWIPLGESLLIAAFRPLWNVRIDGFGNHDPGKGRYKGAKPLWDHLHPGRVWADRCVPRSESQDDVEREICDYFAAHPPTQD
jgi:Eco29kI restriction endonuclease